MKYALKKLNRIILADVVTDKHICTLNDLTNIKISNTSDVVDATGSDGAILAEFDTKKSSEITATNGSIESGAIEAQTGGTEKVIANGTGIRFRESFTLASTTSIVLSHKASGTAGSEIKYIYKADVNGNPSNISTDAYTQAAEASVTAFAFDSATKTITLPTSGFAVGDVVIVDYYPTFSTYKEIDNNSNAFGIDAKVIVDGWFTDLCGGAENGDVPLQFVSGKGKVQGKFDLEFGDKAAVQSLDIKLISSSCAKDSKNLWKMLTYDLDDIVDT